MTYQYLEQFEKYIFPEPNSGCWIWTGYTNEYGYGRFCPKFNMVPLYAHRVSYEIHKGKIPPGLHIDHLCRNKYCVNPDHLEAVTPHENVLRGNAGINNSSKTHCKYGHEFSEKNTRRYGNTRICRECENRRGREKYARSKTKKS